MIYRIARIVFSVDDSPDSSRKIQRDHCSRPLDYVTFVGTEEKIQSALCARHRLQCGLPIFPQRGFDRNTFSRFGLTARESDLAAMLGEIVAPPGIQQMSLAGCTEQGHQDGRILSSSRIRNKDGLVGWNKPAGKPPFQFMPVVGGRK